MSKLSPVKLLPSFKDYIWGGTRLKTDFNKKTDIEPVAESWELSAHRDGQSTVAGGEFAGLTLTQYTEAAGKDILGLNAQKFDYFPILIKLIDAKDNLSVQVHPDDEYALKNEGEYGKTEMWYILGCESGAKLYYGFKCDITEEEYRRAIRENTLTDLLNDVPVHKGDVFFIPSGTVHAIGAGIVICEIQQNSNTTYRVYDYNRRDKNGNTRPLHIEKAVAVSSLSKAPELPTRGGGDDVLLAKCDYFTVRKLTVRKSLVLKLDRTSFRSLIVTDGEGVLLTDGDTVELNKGDSVFIPARDGEAIIEGDCELILSYI